MADKTDFAFKKLANREYTSTAKRWYEEQPNVPFKLKGSDVWIEDIPSIPPSSGTSVIQIFNTLTLTEDVTVANKQSWIAEYPPGSRIGSFIAPRYGSGYTVRVYDGSNSEIPTGDGSSWFFDYEMGILTFDNPPGNYGWITSDFKVKIYRYIGRTADDITTGSGGLAASEIDNDSTVSGVTVKDALENLNTANAALLNRFKYNQNLTAVSGTRIYSLPHTPVADSVQVFINGLLQEPGVGNDYTVSGNIVTFSEDLELNDIILAGYITN